MESDIILIDWLSFTSKIHSLADIKYILGFNDVPWEDTKGAHGYKDRLYFSGVSIHYNGRDDMGIWCELSGQGCRAFESLGRNDYEYIFRMIQYGDCNITRLDIAFDDHSGLLDLDRLCNDTRNCEYVSRLEYWEVTESSKGSTVYHGSPQSDIRIRIYDKARERNCPEGEHWVRVELQLRKARAKKFISLPYNLGGNFCGVLLNYLRYVEPDDFDTNRWRWSIKDYWSSMLSGASAISLYEKPGLEYNIDRCERYVYQYAGNAIDALIQIHGKDKFLDDIKHRGTRPNPKYQQLIATCKELAL